MALTKVTSGVRTLGTGEVATANMATDPTNASNLSSGSVPLAQLGNVDTTGLEDDIALLGFKVASNGSLAKYNLVDQIVDDFQDASGVDASASTNETRDASGKYYKGEVVAYATGDQTSNITVTTDAGLWSLGGSGISNIVDGTTTSASGVQWNSSTNVLNNDVRFEFVNGPVILTEAKYYQNDAYSGVGTWKWQASTDNWASSVDIGSTWSLGSGARISTLTEGISANTTAYQYYKWRGMSGSVNSQWFDEIEFKTGVEGANMTLVSTTTAAQAAPTKGDIVFTYTNGAGSTTLGTDVTAEISADGGSTWTAMTLGSEGSTGSHNIATAHDVTISSTITSPYNMAYRIKTLNQSASKTTRIQAVSLGWS